MAIIQLKPNTAAPFLFSYGDGVVIAQHRWERSYDNGTTLLSYVLDHYQVRNDVEQWLVEHNITMNCEETKTGVNLIFDIEEDAVAFTLRWL